MKAASKQQILIVEDDPELRDIIKDIINLAIPEVQTITAENGEDALRTLACLEMVDNLPDLILTDLMMPFMTGDKMIEEIRNNPRLAHLPIIIVSGSLLDKSPFGLVTVDKPIEEMVLLNEIESHLRMSVQNSQVG